jgi:hypothetical protein
MERRNSKQHTSEQECQAQAEIDAARARRIRRMERERDAWRSLASAAARAIRAGAVLLVLAHLDGDEL